MAKFEIELPDELLVLIDNLAYDAGVTQAEFLRRITEDGLAGAEAAARKRFEELLGPPLPLGGDSAQLIRESRDERFAPFHPKDQDDG